METIRFGGFEFEFLHTKDDTDSSIDMFRMTVQPRVRMPVPHYHESWDETVFGISGTATFRIAEQDIAIGPGQSTFIKRGVVHEFENRTDAPIICLCVLTPGVLGPRYFREIASLAAAGPPDPAKIKEIMLRHGLVPVVGS